MNEANPRAQPQYTVTHVLRLICYPCPRTDIPEHRAVKSRVGQFQAEQMLPADSAADHLGRRSERFSACCSRLTRISCQGASSGCPRMGNKEANSPSENQVPSSIAEAKSRVTARKGGTSPTDSLLGNGAHRLRMSGREDTPTTEEAAHTPQFARSGWSYPATVNYPIYHSRIR
jgi:hypothetical protein